MGARTGTGTHGGRGLSHLGWIPAAAALGFSAAFLLGDRITLPVDLYYALYFAFVLVFLRVYARTTGFAVRPFVSRRLGLAAALGVLGGLALMRGVLARPATTQLEGPLLAWALVWRGLAYGAVDGLLLLAFPWLVSWRAFGAERRRWTVRTTAATIALLGTLLVTTAYHLGYGDFRSRRVVQPNIGAVIGSIPTLLSANPLASVVSHMTLHVTAVLHSPRTDLFLPPHRPAADVGAAPGVGGGEPGAAGGERGAGEGSPASEEPGARD